MPQRFDFTSPPVIISAGGAGATQYTPRANVDIVITNTGTSVRLPSGAVDPIASTGIVSVNNRVIEGTSRANNDSSDTRMVLRPGDNYEFTWAGATAGAVAQIHLIGVQYDAGGAPWE
jgi:hypothetical protein